MKLARLTAGYELEEVAEHIGVTKQAVSLWELGKRTPDPTTRKRLARFYRVTVKKIHADRVDAVNAGR
jgi:transcriptional regulator with XRE-family HTH domain